MEMDASSSVGGGHFDDLVEQAEQLVAAMDGDEELPRVDRSLRQIVEMGKRLWNRTALASGRRDANTDVQASILLGSRGFDLPKISQKLETLSVAKSLEPLEPLPETDIEGFLKNQRENAILSSIEESRNSAFENAEKLFWDNFRNQWEQEKQKILGTFVGAADEIADVSLDAEVMGDSRGSYGLVDESRGRGYSHKTRIGMLSETHARSAMDDIEKAYASKVYVYNEEVIQGGTRLDLIEMFSQVAIKLDDKNSIDLWRMVKAMVDVPAVLTGDISTARSSPALQMMFVDRARKYLEESYVKYVLSAVYGNLRQAQLGGVPGTYALVRSFLNVKLHAQIAGLEDGRVDGQPVWPFIYYCLRCGDLKAALQVSESAGPLLTEFHEFLLEYANNGERRLSPRTEMVLHSTYRRKIDCKGVDPFKRAVYCVIGACDVTEDHSTVADKIDDYLWLRMCQIRPLDEHGQAGGSDRTLPDGQTLSQLQTKLLEEYGESHFHAFEQPYLYFQVLFLTAQFEAAIEFLTRIDRLRSHAVHVAIALYEAKLLLTSSSVHTQLLSRDPTDKVPLRRLNFARVIILYTRKFEATDPRETLQYFYFLRDFKGQKDENLFMSCITELVMETSEFDMLLGRLDNNGIRRLGLIDKFQGDSEKIINHVAAECEARGLLEDAVKLYDLSKKHAKVLELLTMMLSQVVPQPSSPQSKRDRLQTLAIGIAERYKNLDHGSPIDTTRTFYLLLDMMTFFDLYHGEKLREALNVLRRLKLVPQHQSEIERHVVSFQQCSNFIRCNFPEILLATMNILHALYQNAKIAAKPGPSTSSRVSHSQNEEAMEQAEQLQQQAQTIITFAGMLPYCMPGDTVSRLVQKEMLMH